MNYGYGWADEPCVRDGWAEEPGDFALALLDEMDEMDEENEEND